MSARNILLLILTTALGALLLGAILSIPGLPPAFMPADLYRVAARWSREIFDYHGIVILEEAGAAVVAVCAAVYFRLTSEPDVIRLEYRRKEPPGG